MQANRDRNRCRNWSDMTARDRIRAAEQGPSREETGQQEREGMLKGASC
jgi:hypothetical protein